MTNLKAMLLAGGASLALIAGAPALAQDTMPTDPAMEAPAAANPVDGGATIDPVNHLTELGYTNITPSTGAAVSDGEMAFSASNASGEPVEVIIDVNTGTIVRETGGSTLDVPSKDNY